MAFTEPPRWYVISLRPQGEHAPLRRAAAVHSARVIALSPWRLQSNNDPATRTALATALKAQRVLFTSPAAVRAAAALAPLQRLPDQHWIAVGSGTARALRRNGIDPVHIPKRMDSEGLLDLPVLEQLDGTRLGLITAPDGRNLLAPGLRQRGAHVLRADVYARIPIDLARSALRRLQHLDAPAALAVSSGAALQRILETAPADALELLQKIPVVTASERLQQAARQAGFSEVSTAQGPTPQQLLAAIAQRFR